MSAWHSASARSSARSFDDAGVVLGAGGDLHHRDAYAGGRGEVFEVGIVGDVPGAAVVDGVDQVHLLDALAPVELVVLPPVGHLRLAIEDAGRLVIGRVGAAVAAAVGNVAKRPTDLLIAGGLLEHLGAHVQRAVAVVDRREPVLRPHLVQEVSLVDVEVTLAGLGIRRVFPGVVKRGVNQHELLCACRPRKAQERRRAQQTSRYTLAIHDKLMEAARAGLLGQA